MSRKTFIKSILTITSISLCFSAPPTLEDVTAKVCPHHKPYKCLPYGKCYGPETYCQKESQTVQSCFPEDQAISDRQFWCRKFDYNLTVDTGNPCAWACFLYLKEDYFRLMNSSCPESRPYICPPEGLCYNSSEYCLNGIVKSCFSLTVGTSNLLDWCRNQGQHNVLLMEHSTCRLACQTLFTSAQLAPPGETYVWLILFWIAVAVIFIQSVIFWRAKLLILVTRAKNKLYNKKRNNRHRKQESHEKTDISLDAVPVIPSQKKELQKLDKDGSTSVLLRQNSKSIE